MCVIFAMDRVRATSSKFSCSKKGPQSRFTLYQRRDARSRQAGWIIFEILISLALLGVVLTLAQRQAIVQWQTIEHSEANQIKRENRSRADAMVSLTGQDTWREHVGFSSSHRQTYPLCQHCSGEGLQQWFDAAQSASLDTFAGGKEERRYE
ncbi:hypothetical protein MSP8887_01928 [Marinomonas spartinae]|uniref:hypothetical protein n=1 Tax=Marinomonas spartinae TaxID=1792290 RepID=UPI000808DFD8|nr:hypothetical protein [Marinomonas spartinae]SBS33352.1 hypothetical protein MSP8887_01928 [Marinomonas spartinae]